jgi:radical SAM superfamily enzyme YgiQ (UPF0313 family)
MSGVRIYDPELRALGMTLPGFIERGKVIASMPSLGLLTLAGLTPEEWDVAYVEVDALDEESIQQIIGDPASLVAISSLTARIEDAYILADRLRTAGKKVVIGGLHASVEPDEVASHADAVAVGEGEALWRNILDDAKGNALKKFYRASPSHDFGDVTIPRYDLLDLSRYNRIPLQTTRGCPLDCSFCGASRLISPYKRKSIEQVSRELETIRALWPRPFIELADDNTFVNKKWGRQLVEELGKHNIRWFTETDVSIAEDEELLDGLAESGCAQLLIGLESVDDESLSETDSKGWKRRKRDRYLHAIEAIQSRGISVNGCFAFGFDHDDPTCFRRTFEFIRESNLTEAQVTILTPFPGTGLYSRLRSEKRLLHDSIWSRCTLFDLTFSPARMSVDQLRGGFRDLVAELYSEAETARRRKHLRQSARAAKRRPRDRTDA